MQKKTAVLILGLIAMVTGANNFTMSLLLPKIADDFNLSIPAASIMLSFYMVPYGTMQIVYGILADRIGKMKVFKTLTLGFLAGNLGCLFVTSFQGLLFFRFICGFFAAGSISLSLAYIGDNFSPAERSLYVGRFMSMLFIGQALSSLVAGVLMDLLSWRIVFAVLSGILVLGIVLSKSIPNDPRPEPQNIIEQIKPALVSKLGCRVYAISLVTGFVILGFYGFLGSYMSKVLLISSSASGSIMMVYGLACILGGIVMGRLAHKYTLYHFICWGSILFSLSLTAIILAEHPLATAFCMFVIGIAYIFLQAGTATLAFDVAPKAKGLPSALTGMLLFGGGGLGTALGAPILDQYGFQTLFTLFASGVVLLAAYTYGLLRHNHQKVLSREPSL